MINEEQKDCLFQVLNLFQDLGLNKHVALIGSWVEYFYDDIFEGNFIPEIATRDIDFLYRNLRIPKEKIPLIETLKENGFIYREDYLTGVAKFYKKDILELEFLTRIVGPDQMTYKIPSIDINTEGLRELSLLNEHCFEMTKNGITVFIPEPAAYVIHKILINEKKERFTKKEKDVRQKMLFRNIVQSLTKKQRKVFESVCISNQIDFSIISQ